MLVLWSWNLHSPFYGFCSSRSKEHSWQCRIHSVRHTWCSVISSYQHVLIVFTFSTSAHLDIGHCWDHQWWNAGLHRWYVLLVCSDPNLFLDTIKAQNWKWQWGGAWLQLKRCVLVDLGCVSRLCSSEGSLAVLASWYITVDYREKKIWTHNANGSPTQPL